MARQGDYEIALAILIQPDTWRGLDFVQYPEWASHIWHILVLRASRRSARFMFLRSFRHHLNIISAEGWSGSIGNYFYHTDLAHFLWLVSIGTGT
jgi:hypothetical protein